MRQTISGLLDFKKGGSPSVDMTLRPQGPDETVVQYFGEYFIPPARPSDSFLPDGMEEIDVGYTDSHGAFFSKPMTTDNLQLYAK